MPRRTKRVWFLVVPRTGLLNIGNPWEVLSHTNDILGRTAYELELVGPRSPAVTTGHGITVTGVRALPASVSELPHVAIAAGNSPRLPLPEAEVKVASWLRRFHAR